MHSLLKAAGDSDDGGGEANDPAPGHLPNLLQVMKTQSAFYALAKP